MSRYVYPSNIDGIKVGTQYQTADCFGTWSETFRVSTFCQSKKDDFTHMINVGRLRIVAY